MKLQILNTLKIALTGLCILALPASINAAPSDNAADRAKARAATVAYWSAERLAAAEPRDLVVDDKGRWYLRGRAGKLTPYGAGKSRPVPKAKPDNPGGGNGGGGGGKGGGGSDDGDTNVKNAEWTGGGVVQEAAGRIYFVMGGDAFVCSGTLVDDGAQGGRSTILTAAHCVYDEVAGAFSTLALFIPNQADSGTRSDSDCSNDLYGCWAAEFGVVDTDWTTNEWPNNIPYDYAYYVVGQGGLSGNASLDGTIAPMDVSFTIDSAEPGVFTHALGYSYSQDPNFMYCAEPVSHSSNDGWLLGSCGLSGGASGGPWTQSQDADLGVGPVMSVNSYGPSRGRSYMGGPYLYGKRAACMFEQAKTANANTISGC